MVLLILFLCAETILELKTVPAHQIADCTINGIRRLIIMQRHSLSLNRNRLSYCVFILLFRNISQFLHIPQDLIPAFNGIFRVLIRIIIGWRIGNRTEIGNLA